MKKFVKISGVLIEPRKLMNVFYSIRNFYSVFPVETILYYFHGNHIDQKFLRAAKKLVPKSNVLCIPLNLANFNAKQYSNFLKNPEIWNIFRCDYILTIQTDGCLCRRSRYKIKDFLKYDYVGGYSKYNNWWKETNFPQLKNLYKCFNGGFSLRNVSACKEVLKKYPPQLTQNYDSTLSFTTYAEDLYYVIGLIHLGYNVGVDPFATNFCSHIKYKIGTFCIHNTYKYDKNPDKLKIFLSYCPHYKYFISPNYITA